IAKVVVATAVRFDGANVGAARIAAGSVADRTLLLRDLAAHLAGKPMPGGDELDRICLRAASAECAPRDDVRSTAEYRRFVLARLLARLLAQPHAALSG